MMKGILKTGLIISAILFALWCMFYEWDAITEKNLITDKLPSTYQPHVTKQENIEKNISIMPSNSSKIPVVPVHPSDVNVKFPKYSLKEDVVNSDWFKAASYFDYDLRKRPVDYKCNNVQKKGNWRICQDERYFVKPPCLVYSFGIARDFSFDDAMARLGCEVHSFDPRQRTLDVLKIDIETHEWAVIEYLVNSPVIGRVKQFCLEYHLFANWPPKPEYPKYLRLYKKLHDSRFAKFYTGIHGGKNLRPKTFNIQVDIGYVNTAKSGRNDQAPDI